MDVVDDQNKVLGRDTKENIKTKKLNYRVSHIWLFDAQGQLLICRRPAQSTTYAGLWTSSAGGHVKAGESYQQAAVREAAEELGVLLLLEHAFTLEYHHPRGNSVFIGLWFSQNQEKLSRLSFDQREIIEFRFISITALLQEMADKPETFNPQFIQLVHKWREHEPAVKEKNYHC